VLRSGYSFRYFFFFHFYQFDTPSFMFSQGVSSVLANYASTEKKRFSAEGHGDEWYIPYNGPYEAPSRESTVWKRRQRDSWGDPIPLRFNDDKPDPRENGGVEEKIYSHSQTGLQSDFMGGAKIKYGAHGVFDDEWNSAAGIGRYNGAFRERDRAKSKRHLADYEAFPEYPWQSHSSVSSFYSLYW